MNTTPLHSEAANELYEMLSPELRAELSRSEQSMIVPVGTVLIRQGVLPEQLVIVNSGRVAVTLNCTRRSASLDYATAGKVFGMRALVSGELPEGDVTCVEPCSITTLPSDVFLALLQRNPEIYLAVARVLSTDLQIADRILRNYSRRSAFGPRSLSIKTV
jgi:CRP-like cAMP-binding protein